MSNQQLQDYVKAQRSAHVSDEAIKKSLLSVGWLEQDIDSALFGSTNYPDTYNGQLLNPFDLLKRSWKILKERYWTIVGIQLLPLLALLGISVLVLIGVLLKQFVFQNSDQLLIIIAGGTSIIVFFAFIYIALWSQVSVIVAIRDSAEKIGVKESYRRAKGKIGAFLLAGFLSGLVIIGGYLFLIIPGIIFIVWLKFSGYVAIDEEKSGVESLSQSREYSKGLWWEIASCMMFIGLFNMVLNTIPDLFSIFGDLVKVAIMVLIFIFMLLISPLYYIYPFELYRNIKTLKIHNTPYISNKGKLFLLIAAEIAAFMILNGIMIFTTIQSKEAQKVRESSQESINTDSINTSSFAPAEPLMQARDVARTADLTAIRTGLTMYYAQKGTLPPVLTSLVPDYLAEVPTDPKSKKAYEYIPGQNGAFNVCSQFETKSPSRKCVTEKIGKVQGAFSVRPDRYSFVDYLPLSPDFRLFLGFVKNLKK